MTFFQTNIPTQNIASQSWPVEKAAIMCRQNKFCSIDKFVLLHWQYFMFDFSGGFSRINKSKNTFHCVLILQRYPEGTCLLARSSRESFKKKVCCISDNKFPLHNCFFGNNSYLEKMYCLLKDTLIIRTYYGLSHNTLSL